MERRPAKEPIRMGLAGFPYYDSVFDVMTPFLML